MTTLPPGDTGPVIGNVSTRDRCVGCTKLHELTGVQNVHHGCCCCRSHEKKPSLLCSAPPKIRTLYSSDVGCMGACCSQSQSWGSMERKHTATLSCSFPGRGFVSSQLPGVDHRLLAGLPRDGDRDAGGDEGARRVFQVSSCCSHGRAFPSCVRRSVSVADVLQRGLLRRFRRTLQCFGFNFLIVTDIDRGLLRVVAEVFQPLLRRFDSCRCCCCCCCVASSEMHVVALSLENPFRQCLENIDIPPRNRGFVYCSMCFFVLCVIAGFQLLCASCCFSRSHEERVDSPPFCHS